MTRDALVAAFDQWVADPHRRDEVQVVGALPCGGHVADTWPVAAVVYELADEPSRLDDRSGLALRLPETATYAHAARLLWTVRQDPVLGVANYDDAVRAVQGMDAIAFHRRWRDVDAAVLDLASPRPVGVTAA